MKGIITLASREYEVVCLIGLVDWIGKVCWWDGYFRGRFNLCFSKDTSMFWLVLLIHVILISEINPEGNAVISFCHVSRIILSKVLMVLLEPGGSSVVYASLFCAECF